MHQGLVCQLCLMGTVVGGGGGSSGPSLADRFLLRGSVDVFDPASNASINSELSCSNAVVIAKSHKRIMLLNSLLIVESTDPVSFMFQDIHIYSYL